jgi:hypothetical protein
MSRRIAVPVLMATLLALAPMGARADTQTRRYETSLEARATSFPFPDLAGVTSDGTIDNGGVIFAPLGGADARAVTFHVRDDVNALGRVTMFACADLNGSGWCDTVADGGIDEPRVDACLAGDGSGPGATLAGVRPDVPIVVRVIAVWGCRYLLPEVTTNPTVATTGTVTISY